MNYELESLYIGELKIEVLYELTHTCRVESSYTGILLYYLYSGTWYFNKILLYNGTSTSTSLFEFSLCEHLLWSVIIRRVCYLRIRELVDIELGRSFQSWVDLTQDCRELTECTEL